MCAKTTSASVFAQAADDQAHTAIAVGKLSSVLNPVTFLMMNLGVCAILWVGGIQVNVGELTQGQVMAFVNYMTQTLTSIVYVANLVVVFTKASASASRINEVLNCEPSITDEGNQPVALPEPSELAGGTVPVPALSFDHASFSFGAGAANAVSDVTLELPLGKTLGIIGGTGSGKTTLLKALLAECDSLDRIVTVEEVRELGDLGRGNHVSMVVRGANVEGAGAVGLPELVKATLRMRPDRVVLGECRGEEIADLLRAFIRATLAV